MFSWLWGFSYAEDLKKLFYLDERQTSSFTGNCEDINSVKLFYLNFLLFIDRCRHSKAQAAMVQITTKYNNNNKNKCWLLTENISRDKLMSCPHVWFSRFRLATLTPQPGQILWTTAWNIQMSWSRPKFKFGSHADFKQANCSSA